MTEREWLRSKDPAKMLAVIHGRNLRSSRLFATACCRRIWVHLRDDRSRRAVTVAEMCADGFVGEEEKEAVALAAGEAYVSFGVRVDEEVSRLGLPEGGWCDWGNLLSFPGFVNPYADLERGLRPAARSAAPVALPAASVLASAALAAYLAIRPECANRVTADEAAAFCIFFATTTKKTCHYQRGGKCHPGERAAQCELVRDIFGNPFRPRAVDPRWRTSMAEGLARRIYDDQAFDRLPILADALQDAGCEEEDILAHCRSTGPHTRGCWVVDLLLGKG